MQKEEINIGILDIMGSVEEHNTALKKCGVIAKMVKSMEDLEQLSGLIIPGGESTTIGKLMKLYGLDLAIKKRVIAGSLAIWGTCAGAILLAKHVENHKPDNLELMDVTIERNAYGNQLDSFETTLTTNLNGQKKQIPAVFIRAPRFKKLGSNVQILASYQNEPVLIKEWNMLASTFHPEMTEDLTIHKYFIQLAQTTRQK